MSELDTRVSELLRLLREKRASDQDLDTLGASFRTWLEREVRARAVGIQRCDQDDIVSEICLDFYSRERLQRLADSDNWITYARGAIYHKLDDHFARAHKDPILAYDDTRAKPDPSQDEVPEANELERACQIAERVPEVVECLADCLVEAIRAARELGRVARYVGQELVWCDARERPGAECLDDLACLADFLRADAVRLWARLKWPHYQGDAGDTPEAFFREDLTRSDRYSRTDIRDKYGRAAQAALHWSVGRDAAPWPAGPMGFVEVDALDRAAPETRSYGILRRKHLPGFQALWKGAEATRRAWHDRRGER